NKSQYWLGTSLAGGTVRFSSVSVSKKKNLVSNKFSVPKAAKNQKIECQLKNCKNIAPNDGANIGAKPITNIMIENAFAVCLAVRRSRMAARVTTAPTQAPSACKVRPTNNTYSLSVVAQIIEAITYKIVPIYRGLTRPTRSLRGP